MLYAMLLALFLPMGLLYNYFEQRQLEFNEVEHQSSLFYVDQLRQVLPIYRQSYPAETEASWERLAQLLPRGFELKERNDVKRYLDDRGFYLVWEDPKPGLASRLVSHYSRPGGQGTDLIFYHIGFSEDQGNGKICLRPSRHYQYVDSYVDSSKTCLWPLPGVINKGSLVLTDREPGN